MLLPYTFWQDLARCAVLGEKHQSFDHSTRAPQKTAEPQPWSEAGKEVLMLKNPFPAMIN